VTEAVVDDLFTIRVMEQPGVHVECYGEMDICAVPELQAALLAAMRKRRDEVQVDMARVRYIDSACIKALLSARDTVGCAGGRLTLIDPSPVVRRALRLLALDAHFGLAS